MNSVGGGREGAEGMVQFTPVITTEYDMRIYIYMDGSDYSRTAQRLLGLRLVWGFQGSHDEFIIILRRGH